MDTLYICGEADICRDESTILIKSGKVKKRIPIENVQNICIMSDGTFTTKFIALAGKNQLRISFFDYYGWFVGSFEPGSSISSGEMLLRQAKMVANPAKRIIIAREIVEASLDNIVSNLKYYAYRGNPELKLTCEYLAAVRSGMKKCTEINEIMGIEGLSRRTYYSVWKKIDTRLDFTPRVKRPPNNQINCLISYMNGLAYGAVRHEIAKTCLDEKLSFLHSPSAQRSSLSLDLSEPFKPVLVDRLIFKMVRKNMIDDGWFDQKPGVCMLNEIGRRNVVEAFANAADRVQGEKSIRMLMRDEALKLQRWILEIDDFTAYRAG